jgi:hypothetical protein
MGWNLSVQKDAAGAVGEINGNRSTKTSKCVWTRLSTDKFVEQIIYTKIGTFA